MQPAHCGLTDACVVGSSGLGLAPGSSTQYGDFVAVSGHHQPGGEALPYTTAHPGSDFASAMYVNTVWPDQSSHHPAQGVYYDSYSNPVYASYPGHMMSQEGPMAPYPSMSPQSHESGKRKRRRVITYEQRKAANVRERKRMCHLNDAFDVLRKRVPTFAYEKKLSRIETLKLAVTYIQYMAELLEDMDESPGKTKSTKKMKNPFEGMDMQQSPGESEEGSLQERDSSSRSPQEDSQPEEEEEISLELSPSQQDNPNACTSSDEMALQSTTTNL